MKQKDFEVLDDIIPQLRVSLFEQLSSLLSDLDQLSLIQLIPLQTRYDELSEAHYEITAQESMHDTDLIDTVNFIQKIGLIDNNTGSIFRRAEFSICQ